MTTVECIRCGRPAPIDPIGRITCDCAIRDQQEAKRLRREARVRLKRIAERKPA